MSDVRARFDAALAASKTLPTQPSNVQLDLYGLFKQATKGDVQGKRPGGFDLRGKAKYDAWSKHTGQSTDDAMTAYADYVDKLAGR